MNPRSLLATFVAIVAALGLALTLSPGTAQAAPGSAAAAALPQHRVKYKAQEIGNSGKFTTWGTVFTATRGQRIYLQSHRRGGTWRVAQVKRLPGNGAFRFNFDGPIGTRYRIKINRGHGYGEYIGNVGTIVRQRTGKTLPR